MEYRCEICDIKQKTMLMCKRCKYITCKGCIKNYLIHYANMTPKCPNCNLGFTIDEVQACLGKTKFVKFLQESTKISVALEKQKIPEVLEKANTIKLVELIKSILSTTFKDEMRGIKLYIFYRINTDFLNVLYDKFIFKNYTDSELTAKGLDPIKYNKHNIKTLSIDSDPNPARVITRNLNTIYFNVLYRYISTFMHYKYCINFGNYLRRLQSRQNSIYKLYDTNEQAQQLMSLCEKITNYNDYETYELQPICNLKDCINGIIIDDESSYTHLDRLEGVPNIKEIEKKEKFIMPCSTENCRGMINNKYECNLCNRKFCNKCIADITDSTLHECKKCDIENFKFIMSTTKPCPNCSTRIFKSEGCSQMFCIVCHSGFDYNTGKLITGDFHNPHRIAWLKENSKINQQYTCGNIQDTHFANCEILISLVHRKNHIVHITNTNYIYRLNDIRNTEPNNMLYKMRLAYVLGKTTENQFYMQLRRIETKKHKYNQYIPLYTTYTESITDIINMIYAIYSKLSYAEQIDAINNPEIKSYIEQIDTLADTINSELQKISIAFNNCLYYKITKILDPTNSISNYLVKSFK